LRNKALFGGLKTTNAFHPRLIGKLLVDFLLVLIELFYLGVGFATVYAFEGLGWTDARTDNFSRLPVPRLHRMQRG